MKQIFVILFLLVLELITSAQSRILTGTISASPNTSTTILPQIVVAKSTDGQKEDSGMFNPRYVPPPPVDSSKLIANIPASTTNNVSTQAQSGGVVETNYQYKTPESKPYLDGGAKPVTPSVTFHKPQPIVDRAESYQYKTPDGKPIVDSKIQANSIRSHFSKRVAIKPFLKGTNTSKDENVTNPDELAANSNYGNVSTTKPIPKWQQKKPDWKKPITTEASLISNEGVKNSKPASKLSPSIAQSSQTLTPVINRNANSVNITSGVNNNNNNTQENITQRSDYKAEITTDGKFNLTFYNNGSNITVTSFGRIAGVSSPANGTSIAQQYDYRGLLQSVGGLPLQYTYEGRLQSVGSTNLSYNYNGNIQSIGNTPVYYNYNGTVDKIGNTKVIYDANGSVSGTNGANPMITIKQ